ncbi:MAG: tRNA (N(6)-L-threonylcarbamoyladenosine(37)-C(2))-methylthiotransferase MtaB [Proteobacteria bacterium]|nr:tRNA (N(6)-L-threonylcarbamoyladenosine(37)-C(2))-methylthiotransferase MtaB [Pseudomonadota bacterium]
MKFFIHTTGCKANQWDSYVMKNKLRDAGLALSSLLHADFIIINACTVTGGAERDIRRFINRCRRMNKTGKIILAGCHSQAYPGSTFGADIILGQNEKFNVEKFLEKKGCFVEGRGEFSLEGIPAITGGLQEGKTRFFFKIQDGCDKFCSYCIVPYARGIPRSRPAGEVLEFLRDLKEKGIKEVVLTGIEISAYHDSVTGSGLKGLLRTLENHETPERIRLSSIDPLYIDNDFIDIVASSKKITKSLHIPLQSGSDRILALMKRNYTQAYIRKILERLNRKIPDIGIGMDVIAGFPTEDEKAFEETCRFLESIDIYYLHVFPFSARAETEASLMEGSVTESAKKQRVHELKGLDTKKRQAFYQRFMGADVLIIPEGKLYKGLYMRGYTDNYIPVHIPCEKTLENKLVKVTITGMDDGLVMGIVKGEM